MAVILALFCIKVEDVTFAFWKARTVIQNGCVGNGCGNHCGDIECLFALRLACRCAEIAKGGNGAVADKQYLWWYGYLITRPDCTFGKIGLQFLVAEAILVEH